MFLLGEESLKPIGARDVPARGAGRAWSVFRVWTTVAGCSRRVTRGHEERKGPKVGDLKTTFFGQMKLQRSFFHA